MKLVFAGDGPYRTHLQGLCPQAIFLGMCTHTQLAPVYASADLFVFPSLTETFGNVTVESLACGTPVVAYDCAAAGALIEVGCNGWLVPGDDAQAFVDAVVQAAQGREVLDGLRASSSDSVQSLAWSSIAQQAEAVFRRVLTQSPG